MRWASNSRTEWTMRFWSRRSWKQVARVRERPRLWSTWRRRSQPASVLTWPAEKSASTRSEPRSAKNMSWAQEASRGRGEEEEAGMELVYRLDNRVYVYQILVKSAGHPFQRAAGTALRLFSAAAGRGHRLGGG